MRNVAALEELVARQSAVVARQSAAIAELTRRLDSTVARIDELDGVVAGQGFTRSPATSAPTTAPPVLADPTRAPAVTAAPAAAPSTAAPTAAPSPAPTAAPTREDIAVGNIIVSQLRNPAARCTGGSLSDPTGCSILSAEAQAAIVQVNGSVLVSHAGTAANPTLAGLFPNLRRVGGDFRVASTYITDFGDGAFGALETVEGDFELKGNPLLRIIDGSSIGALRTVGGDFEVSDNDALLAINGTAFGALRTVGGDFEVSNHAVLHVINGTAFGALETVRGHQGIPWNASVRASKFPHSTRSPQKFAGA